MLQHLFETPPIEQVQLKRFMCYKKKEYNEICRLGCHEQSCECVLQHAHEGFELTVES